MTTSASDARWPDPLVARVLDDAGAHDVRVLGISGLQGTGKSTLATQLVAAADARGLRAGVLSLDDIYLDHDARARLAREVHPLLATRGPPGTHEVALGVAILEAVRAGDFHVYPVSTIEDALELLTGIPAGKPRKDGGFTKDSIYDRVDKRLDALAKMAKQYEGRR